MPQSRRNEDKIKELVLGQSNYLGLGGGVRHIRVHSTLQTVYSLKYFKKCFGALGTQIEYFL